MKSIWKTTRSKISSTDLLIVLVGATGPKPEVRQRQCWIGFADHIYCSDGAVYP